MADILTKKVNSILKKSFDAEQYFRIPVSNRYPPIYSTDLNRY